MNIPDLLYHYELTSDDSSDESDDELPDLIDRFNSDSDNSSSDDSSDESNDELPDLIDRYNSDSDDSSDESDAELPDLIERYNSDSDRSSGDDTIDVYDDVTEVSESTEEMCDACYTVVTKKRIEYAVTLDHRYDHTMAIVLTQMTMSKGLKIYGDRVAEVVTKELK